MKQLNMDDFRVGMLIVGMGRAAHEVPIYGGMMGLTPVGTMMREDNSYRGSVYIVLAIDMPFMVIQRVANEYGHNGHKPDAPMSHDLRSEFRWGAASREFVEAMRPGVWSEPKESQ